MEKPREIFFKAKEFFINLENITYVYVEPPGDRVEIAFATGDGKAITLYEEDASRFLAELDYWTTTD